MTERRLRVGDWVEVRSREEILGTLDGRAECEGMPFMPEMLAFCGKRFQVVKRAHKTCDTVFPVRGRRVERAVHLNTRCDGGAHDGCQAGCLIFWKEIWLKRIDPGAPASVTSPPGLKSNTRDSVYSADRISEADIRAAARSTDSGDGAPTYACQATRLPYATSRLRWWDARQYVEDYSSGNVSMWRLICGLTYSLYYTVSQAGVGLGRPMRWLYNKLHRLWGGPAFPRMMGSIPDGQPTPAGSLGLQPGEYVRVKSQDEILRTLTTTGKNRGMRWDAEMVPYCGGTYRVLKRVTRIIDEKNGQMQNMQNPCIVLDSVVCQARYSECRMFCPRAIYPYWREIWLERVNRPPEILREETHRKRVSPDAVPVAQAPELSSSRVRAG